VNSVKFEFNSRFLSLEDLLNAGINHAEYLIIVNKEKSSSGEELAMEDSNTIMAVQYIFR
jgi:hypothetical protein